MRYDQAHIGEYIVRVNQDGEITVMGGYDTHIGWSGDLDSAITWVRSQTPGLEQDITWSKGGQ